jgi:hypothetical protein
MESENRRASGKVSANAIALGGTYPTTKRLRAELLPLPQLETQSVATPRGLI